MANKEKVYGVADKAWQVVVGCDPHEMPHEIRVREYPEVRS